MAARTLELAARSFAEQLEAEPRFRFVTINEDAWVADARAFLTTFRFDFPVMLGFGKVKNSLHSPGLPYTVLLDTQGRII